mgnify:CR=1 FL=1
MSVTDCWASAGDGAATASSTGPSTTGVPGSCRSISAGWGSPIALTTRPPRPEFAMRW